MAEETGGVETPITDPGVVIEGQPDTAPWYQSALPEAYHANPTVTRYTSLEEYVKGTLALEKKMGEKAGVQFPGADATPEDWQAFWRTVPGYPETPAGYTVEPPKMPEGSPYELDEAEYQDLLRTLHTAGVAPQHVNAMVRWFEQNEAHRMAAGTEEALEMVRRGEQALEQKWGARADYNVRVAEEGLLREFGNLDFLDTLVTKDSEGHARFLRNSPEFIQLAYEWAMAKGHDKFVAGGPGGPASKAQAEQQMTEARQAYRQGNMTIEEFNRTQERLAPIIYADEDLSIMAGAFTGRDIADDEQ